MFATKKKTAQKFQMPAFAAALLSVLLLCFFPKTETHSYDLSTIPAYSGEAYVILNENQPEFDTEELSTESYEYYSELDALGRCGTAYALIGTDLMPTEERTSIGHVKPSGWHTIKYDIIRDKYLYNRCHLIGFQLTGENANEKNLITGTRQMNVEGMQPFETDVAKYIKETDYHVMYRVTPIYEGNNLVANGVQMEAYSVEDNGKGICFNVFVYNVQDGIEIDYATGESQLADKNAKTETNTAAQTQERSDSNTNAQSDAISNTNTQSQNSIASDEPAQPSDTSSKGAYAVNEKNGKIHKVGACYATGESNRAMTDAVYFDTYEEALSYSQSIVPDAAKRECGNCWAN